MTDDEARLIAEGWTRDERGWIRPDIQWGPAFAGPEGYIAELGSEGYTHRFGGASWSITDSEAVHGGPTLLLVLDLTDPHLQKIRIEGCDELPLCSYINCPIFIGLQVYEIECATRNVRFINREIATAEPPPEEYRFPNPLVEQPLKLRPMETDDYPVDEDTFWRAFDKFLGRSDAFLRILGPPLWDRPQVVPCDCGTNMEYFAGIGHDTVHPPSGIIPGGELFIGEEHLCFHICTSCKRIAVTSQPT